jgi:hypothetical protein
MSNSSKGSSGSGAEDSMTARTQSWEARTLTVTLQRRARIAHPGGPEPTGQLRRDRRVRAVRVD